MMTPLTYGTDRKANWLVYALWGALIWVLGLAPAAQALTSRRTFGLSHQEVVLSYSASSGGLSDWVYFGELRLALVLGVMSILLGLASREGRLPKAGLALWLGAMAFALGPLVSSRFGLQPHLLLGLFGLPIVFTAIYLLPPVPLAWFVRQAKRILLLYAYGSLLAAVVAPSWAVENPYTGGLIPGFDIRLHGLVLHANLLAPFLLTYLILSWFSPSKTRWESLHQVVVLLALALTQSKTVWILLVLAYLIRLAYAAWGLPGLQRYTVLAFVGAVFSGGTLYLVTGPAWLDNVEIFFGDEEFTTLTGRTLIWQVTLNLWERNPWFGYGPDLWNSKMGLTYAPVVGHVAPHAHSQFYQTLGVAGIIGIAGLFLYAIASLAYGIRYARTTNGVALALVAAILLRGITEPSLDGIPGNSGFYPHFLTFAFLVLALRWRSTLDEEYRETPRSQPLPALARGGPLVPPSEPDGNGHEAGVRRAQLGSRTLPKADKSQEHGGMIGPRDKNE